MNKILLIVFLFIWQTIKSQDTILDKLSYFIDEYRIEAQKDSSRMWGISFDVPLIISLPKLNKFVLNKNAEGFQQYKKLFIGTSNDLKSGGNGKKTWNNEDWGFYTYPLPENKKERISLFFHEAFHRNQPKIELDGNWTQCKHLNNSDARSLLKLELNALIKSLKETEFKQSLIDALSFRFYRYQLYPNAYIEEQSMEILEGLAEYTGLKLADYSTNDVLEFLEKRLTYNPQTFAYCTGLLYGYILDKSNKNWRTQIKKNDNFLYFVQKIYDIKFPVNIKLNVERVREKYNWKTILKEEKYLSKEMKKQNKKYMKMFFKNTVVKIDSKLCNGWVYNTTIIFPIKNGKVYNGITTQGNWGELIAKDEIFIGDEIILATPIKQNDKIIEGNGWKIILNENWSIEMNSQNNYELKKNK